MAAGDVAPGGVYGMHPSLKPNADIAFSPQKTPGVAADPGSWLAAPSSQHTTACARAARSRGHNDALFRALPASATLTGWARAGTGAGWSLGSAGAGRKGPGVPMPPCHQTSSLAGSTGMQVGSVGQEMS